MKVTSDFKMIIIIDDNLPIGLKCNTAAVLSLTFGKKIDGLIDKDLTDKSGDLHHGLTNQPIPILKSTFEEIKELRKLSLKHEDLLVIDVTDVAQTAKNYKDYENKLKSKTAVELIYLGIAIAGNKKSINSIAGNLGLLR